MERNALAIDSDRFYWLQSDRINATRPRIGGIRKWEMTSAGRIGVIAEVIWIDVQTREEWRVRDTAIGGGVVEQYLFKDLN